MRKRYSRLYSYPREPREVSVDRKVGILLFGLSLFFIACATIPLFTG